MKDTNLPTHSLRNIKVVSNFHIYSKKWNIPIVESTQIRMHILNLLAWLSDCLHGFQDLWTFRSTPQNSIKNKLSKSVSTFPSLPANGKRSGNGTWPSCNIAATVLEFQFYPDRGTWPSCNMAPRFWNPQYVQKYMLGLVFGIDLNQDD